MSLKSADPNNKQATVSSAADSGSGPTAVVTRTALTAPNEATAKALKKDILAPRFYTTNFEKLDKLVLDSHKEEFAAILEEFRADHNRGHFRRTPEFLGEFPNMPKEEFEEFLRRSCLGEFSGCLLYQEISRRSTNPYLKEVFRHITRDEGRHASHLTHTMQDLDIKFDLGFLSKAKERVKIPPKLMFITVYLSEIIGYYRYITIYDHLEANPEKRFHPIFKSFGRWCNDEHRHGHFFALLMRSQYKTVLKGPINHLLIKFFTLSVYMTMFLRDAKPASQTLYRAMGLDPREYDLHVIKRCDDEASTVWGFKFQVEHPTFVRMLDNMAANNQQLQALDGKKGLQALAGRLSTKAKNVGCILRLMTMPTVKAKRIP